MNTAPGLKGVDAVFIGSPKNNPGFAFAELKPLSYPSFKIFLKQLWNWKAPHGSTQLWFYNKQGIIGSSGTNY